MTTNYIARAVRNAGRSAVCQACCVDVRAVRRWEERGKLPRTDWTGETRYAFAIAALPDSGVTVNQLLPIPAHLKKLILEGATKQ